MSGHRDEGSAKSALEFTVCVAETGDVHRIGLSRGEETVEYFKHHVYESTGVVPEHQILLVGPPFKPFERNFTPVRLPDGQDIFLYDRQTLMAPGAPATAPSLVPQEIVVPTEPEPRPAALCTPSPCSTPATGSPPPETPSPLLQTILTFERNFMLALNRGQAYAAGGEARLRACEECVGQTLVQHRALEAAASNLSDHSTALQQAVTYLQGQLTEQRERHQQPLESFEEDLARLESIQLHPSLADPSAGRNTLLDMVPVDRERKMLATCQESHRRLLAHELERREEAQRILEGVEAHLTRAPPVDLSALEDSIQRGEHLLQRQRERLAQLEQNYHSALDTATGQVQGSGSASLGGSTLAMSAIHELNELYTAQQGLVPAMEQDDAELRAIMEQVGSAKWAMTGWLQECLRAIARLQNSIHRFQSQNNLTDKARNEKELQFTHLGRVRRLSAAYQAFLLEVVRRRAYEQVFESRVSSAMEAIAVFRSREILAREVFRREHLVNLPPPFLEAAPALANMPPHFNPTILEDADQLPDIRPADIGMSQEDLEAAVLQPPRARGPAQGPGGDDQGGHMGQSSGEGGNEVRGSVILQPEEEEGQGGGDLGDPAVRASLVGSRAALQYENALLRAELVRWRQSVPQRPRPTAEGEGDQPGSGLPQQAHQSQQTQPPETSTSQTQTAVPEPAVPPPAAPPSQPAGPVAAGSPLQSREQLSAELDALRAGLSDIERIVRGLATEARQDAHRASTPDRTRAASTPAHPRELALEGTQTLGAPSPGGAGSQSALAGGLPPTPGGDVRAVVSSVEAAFRLFKDRLKRARMDLAHAEEELAHISAGVAGGPRISFCEFHINDVALFLPTSQEGEERIYLAFHMGCPHRYLAPQSIDLFRRQEGRYPDFILGKIIMIDEMTADEGRDGNPYQLPLGTVFYILTAEKLS